MIFVDRTMWGWSLIVGLLGIAAGLIVLDHPVYAPLLVGSAITIVLGIQGIVIGVVGIVAAFSGGGWPAGILGGVSLLIGVLLLANLWVVTISLPWVIGILAIVGGIMAIFGSFQLKSAA